jgi:hypothetical protein
VKLEELRQKLKAAEDTVTSIKSKIAKTEKKLKNPNLRKVKEGPKDKNTRIIELESLLEKEKAEKAILMQDFKRDKEEKTMLLKDLQTHIATVSSENYDLVCFFFSSLSSHHLHPHPFQYSISYSSLLSSPFYNLPFFTFSPVSSSSNSESQSQRTRAKGTCEG